MPRPANEIRPAGALVSATKSPSAKDVVLGGVVQCFELYVDAIAMVAPVPLTGREERSRLFGRFGLHAPLLQSRDSHRRVERFQTSFLFRHRLPSLCESEVFHILG